ncbi:MAG: hypothetical protein ACTSXA_09710 [Candidatus Heimdallarchaeota archaeon]
MILTTIIGSTLIFGIFEIVKEKKKDLEFIKEIKHYQEWASLEEIIKEPSKYQGKRKREVWITARLYELNPQKTIKYFSALLNDEFKETNFKSELVKALPIFSDFEDKELVYDQIFDSILILQKEYFSELQLHETRSTSGYYYLKITPGIMKEFAGFFNLTTDEFISKNTLKAFMRIIGYMEANESLHLKRIAELCRIPDNRAHQFLMKLLEYYPELGNYNDFTMIFKPSKKIFNFEEIVDFERLIYS